MWTEADFPSLQDSSGNNAADQRNEVIRPVLNVPSDVLEDTSDGYDGEAAAGHLQSDQNTSSTRTLHRMGKTGRYVLAIRECYTRDDLPCGSMLCEECERQSAVLSVESNHYVVPFVDALSNYTEIFCHESMRSVIFCQTVLRRVLFDRGRRTYGVIQGFVQSKENSIIFLNEVFSSTHTERKTGESVADWRFRAVFNVAVFYLNHLQSKVPIIIVTDEASYARIYATTCPNLFVVSLEKYLALFHAGNDDLSQLLSSLQAAIETNRDAAEGKVYPEHLSSAVCETGLSTGAYVKGILRVNAKRAQTDAYVTPSTALLVAGESEETESDENNSGDIFIDGQLERNRAVHNDEVIVKIKCRDEWKKREDSTVPTGTVVAISSRRWRDCVCTIAQSDDKKAAPSSRILFVPFDWRIPKVRVATSNACDYVDKRVLVRLDSWPSNSQYPNGHVVEVLGPVGNLNVEVDVILIEHGLLPTKKVAFTEAQHAELPSADVLKTIDTSGRRDLRQSHVIFSIDPPDCEDIDDALSVAELPNGNIELGVHIADVTKFCAPGSLIDKEAARRATSVYLADRRLDMLPSLLCTDLCSLWSGVDRYAVSVLAEMDSACKTVRVWYGRTVIRSAFKLEYSVAQNIFDGMLAESAVPKVTELSGLDSSSAQNALSALKLSIGRLVKVAKILSSRRAGLQLESTEVGFELDRGETTVDVQGIKAKESILMHEVIAECMIFANSLVANKILSAFPAYALIRSHPPPTEKKLQQLKSLLQKKGFTLDSADSKTLGASLGMAVDKDDPSFNETIRTLAVYAMQQAVYRMGPELDSGHFGLALDEYTHFTSPIRRYADVIVHRLLLDAVEGRQAPSFPLQMDLCEHLNQMQRAAKYAQRASVEYFQAKYFCSLPEDDQKRLEEAIIYRLENDTIGVIVPKWGLRGALFFEDSQNLARVEDSNCFTLTVQTGKEECLNLTYFDHVMVRVTIEESKYHLPRFRFHFVRKMAATEFARSQVNGAKNANLIDSNLDGDIAQVASFCTDDYFTHDWMYDFLLSLKY